MKERIDDLHARRLRTPMRTRCLQAAMEELLVITVGEVTVEMQGVDGVVWQCAEVVRCDARGQF